LAAAASPIACGQVLTNNSLNKATSANKTRASTSQNDIAKLKTARCAKGLVKRLMPKMFTASEVLPRRKHKLTTAHSTTAVKTRSNRVCVRRPVLMGSDPQIFVIQPGDTRGAPPEPSDGDPRGASTRQADKRGGFALLQRLAFAGARSR